MTKNIDITFVIVTWNNEKEIKNCLLSIGKYINNKRIIVVDNNSGDGTVSIIKRSFSDIEVIKSKDNLGFAKANNLALNLTNTKYVCFLNPDVILTEDIVSPSIDILEENKDIGIVACSLKNQDGSKQASTFNYSGSIQTALEVLHVGAIMPSFVQKRYFMNYYDTREDFRPDWVIGAELIMRTADAKNINGFSEEYFMYTEDMDLCKKVSSILKKEIYFLSNVSLIHIGGASEAQNVNYNKQRKLYLNTIYFINKFYNDIEAKKYIRNIKIAYKLRKYILYLLYWKEDRKYQIDRTEKSINILNEITLQ